VAGVVVDEPEAELAVEVAVTIVDEQI